MLSAPARGHIPKWTVTPYAAIAPLYDTLLGHLFFPQLRRAFEWLARYYRVTFTSAADIACGTGTFVRYLRQRGVAVVYGVDRSPEMLRIATQKNLGNGARFLLQDFSTLQLPQPVDLITCHFDSLNYLLTTEALLRALCRIRANLGPGGHLVFDMITDRSPWPDSGPHIERVTRPGLALVRVTRRKPGGIQTSHIFITRNGRAQHEVHVQRRYPVEVVAGLLARAQFRLLGVHDFHTLGSATAGSSRAVYVARMV